MPNTQDHSYTLLHDAFDRGVTVILSQAYSEPCTTALNQWLARYCMAARMIAGPIEANDILAMKQILDVNVDANDPESARLMLTVALKTIGEYRARLMGAANRLFSSGDVGAFTGTFARSIDVQLTEAWNEGAKSVGVDPDEMNQDDIAILEAIIANENEFISGLASDIFASRDEGMEVDKFTSKFGARIDLWAQRYPETVNRARMQFGTKTRLQWQLGATEDHCPECASLNGIVAFGGEWEAARLHPQTPPNHLLSCGGWKCDCRLQPTKARRSARALDRLMTIAQNKAG